MQKHASITLQRIKTFKEDRGLHSFIYPEKCPVELSVFHAPGRISYDQAVQMSYSEARIGDFYGPEWSTHWFRVQAIIPDSWDGREVHFLWNSSSEACVWIDGEPRQGLTGTGSLSWEASMGRLAYRLSHKVSKGEVFLFYIEMACNGLFGTVPDVSYQLRQAEIAQFDPLAWDLYWDYVVIADMAEFLPGNSPRAGQALWTANKIINTFQKNDRETWSSARCIAADFLKETNGTSQHNISAIGYAHLDTAWLWPLAETKRKIIRTFSTTMRLMEDYPGYKFASAQAQHLVWLKEMQPMLYDQVKDRIQEGRFVLVGGTWIEPDCNIPSGESIIRQFLFGQKFFLDEYGKKCTEFWNPDVFGYSGALPQIMRGCGVKYFLTQKLSWNQLNKPASHTFLWEGIDGSQVLTHFPPADTYGSAGNVADVKKSVDLFKEHDRSKESILIFGWGDGGGGPTPEMLEQINRMNDVDGLPKVQIRSVNDFFERCEKDIKAPVKWVGELYFEYHRGTYTTQAANKRDNRKCELLLRDLEIISSISSLLKNLLYPKAQLDDLWKTVLLNQFHDILPGSSINEVYKDSAIDYINVIEKGSALLDNAVSKYVASGINWIAINTLSKNRREIVELPSLENSDQTTSNNTSLCVVEVPPLSFKNITPKHLEKVVKLELIDDGFLLENEFITVTLNSKGNITQLFHKNGNREVVEDNKLANRFVLFDDDPINFEAWDVDIFHLEKRIEPTGAISARVLETGPIRVAIEFIHHLSDVSSIRQIVYLTSISPRIDFHTWVDWHEDKKFLKVEFPWAVRSEYATYEIQFGHVQRPTHYNTSWDLARFEVCAHKWADLSETGFGVAIINDSKYGYSTYGNVMSLSLLRSPKSPDPYADMGEHFFKYAVYPHSGTFQEAGVIDEGYRFNVPMIVRKGQVDEVDSFIRVDQPGIIVDTIKMAEDESGLIVRLYEAFGGRCSCKLECHQSIKSVYSCNMLEEEEQELVWNDDCVVVQIKPFQVITLKLLKY